MAGPGIQISLSGTQSEDTSLMLGELECVDMPLVSPRNDQISLLDGVMEVRWGLYVKLFWEQVAVQGPKFHNQAQFPVLLGNHKQKAVKPWRRPVGHLL